MKLKILRITKGLKQYELAEAAGISREYLRLIENGSAKNPSRAVMEKISKVLDASVVELFF